MATNMIQPKDDKRCGYMRFGNSFDRDEVNGFLALYRCVLRGGDGRDLARSGPVIRLVQKFGKMRKRYQAERQS
jgi:hypothetical protein